MNIVEQIIKYENGLMEENEMTSFFQQLIDTGMAWSLQGHYGRTAMSLIENGYCILTPNEGQENEDMEKI